ncbi:MAG: hypothetical protein M3495_06900 [Pseudomonadota bacterium]|nr:hypothetical protein [Gammaproteobacteria bacterium]MDQ3581344.1 hypothetical protein [Pseudomonadota bacterium]
MRGLLGEYGIVFAQGAKPGAPWPGGVARRGRPPALRDGRELLGDLNGQLRALDERSANYDARVKAACATDERCPASAR